MTRPEREDPLLPPGPRHDLDRLLWGRFQACGLTYTAVAKDANYGVGHVSEVLRGLKDPSPEAARSIMSAMRAGPAGVKEAWDLGIQVRKVKDGLRRDRFRDVPLHSMVNALVRAWREQDPAAARRAVPLDSPVWQAVEAAVAGAIAQYATSDGRLDVAAPLLTEPALLAMPAVSAEFAKVLTGRGTPNADLIGMHWRDALTDPTQTRDFAVEAEALVKRFAEASAELRAWLGGGCGADRRVLASIGAQVRRKLAEVAALGGQVTLGPLPPSLRMRLRDQTSVIGEHVDGFVGRERLLGRIDEIIRTWDSGYCHVLAHPGVGKTALMAALIKSRNYIHHFNNRALGVVSAEEFLGNVCARLIARYQPVRLPGPGAFDNGVYLSELLAEIAATHRDEKIVIVVDALDERDPGAQLPGTNPLFLPEVLPSGVVFVVASRPENETRPIPEWAPTRIRTAVRQVVQPIDHLGEENMADIRTYLRPWTGKEGVAGYMRRFGYDATMFVEELARRSEGNFMYLHHMLPAIDGGTLRDRELADLPFGLRQYYEQQLARMRDEDAGLWYDYRLPVIGAFAAMDSGPLTVAEIAALSGIGDEGIIKDTLRKWSAFVVASLVPGEDRGLRLAYHIYHASFADFLRDFA